MTAPPNDALAGAAEAVTTAFLRALARGAWDDAAALAALTVPPDTTAPEFLRDLWTRLVVDFGALRSGRVAAAAPHGTGRTVDVAVRLATADVVLRLVVSAEARVTGFWISPPRAVSASPPANLPR